MSLISFLLALLRFLPASGGAPSAPSSYGQLKEQAEQSYAEKSFGRAHGFYEQALKLPSLAPDERRWIEFRLADTAWRNDAASPLSDPTARSGAQTALEQLILKSGDDHDRVWAEANESLGDLHAFHPYLQDYTAVPKYWTAALDWWEGSDDLPLARRRYLDIVWRLSQRNLAPKDLLVKALSVAESPNDRDHARFLLAQKLLQEQKPESVERGLEHLDILIGQGRKGTYYDQALFAYAGELSYAGSVVVLDNGESGFRKDYLKALELLRRIVAEYQPGESPLREQALSQIDQITLPAVGVYAGATFLPSSEQQVVLTWRNVTSIELTLAAVDLTRDVRPGRNLDHWIDHLQREREPVLRRWTFETGDKGEHIPGSKAVRIEPKLGPGAYVVTATNGQQSSRQLLLVSDIGILAHSVEGHLQILVADVMSGEPVAGARVRVLDGRGTDPALSVRDAETNANGVAEIRMAANLHDQTLITASKGSRQAYHASYLYSAGSSAEPDEWRIYAFTDRPAYRPGETVQWKVIARTRKGGDWTTPAGRKVEWEISGPRDDKIASGVAELNAFGSFWAELPVTAEMPLGGYTVILRQPSDKDNDIGTALLFSIEEYKLPEFRVTVSTPEEDGKKKRYRLGDTIEASVEASYYFGGPVANATVEVDIEKAPYHRDWHPWHEYGWFYPDQSSSDDSGSGEELHHETLKTDASGRAVVHIDTDRDGPDTAYIIAVKVTDASRREVTGSGTVAVMKQRYAVNGHPQHYLRLPNERVSIDFNAADANDEPVPTTGTVKVFRRTWEEIWTDPAGRDVTVREVERARAATAPFPPPGWRQRVASYHDEEVTTSKVNTDVKGNATFTFTPSRTGYYVAKWTSEDRDGDRPLRARDLVTAETAVWVTEHATNEVGYHSAGLDLVIDQDTVHAGATMPVMIATPSSGRWVMVTTTTLDIDQTQVVHLDGTVKMIELPIDRHHIPNFFITASSMFDRAVATETKEIVVPPVEKFVKVEVHTDREDYEPRQKGTVTVTTRDAAGKPVPAEVAVAVSDASVTAIAQDYAGDPRQFFYNDLRTQSLGIESSVLSQRYVRLVEDGKGALVDEQATKTATNAAAPDSSLLLPYYEVDGANQTGFAFGGRGVVGGVVGGVQTLPAPPPPKPVADAITVTTEAPLLEAITVAKPSMSVRLNMVTKRDTEPTGIQSAAAVQVRHDFRSTAFWRPDVITGADGKATVSFDYPEALTTWRTTARAVTAGSQFGMASATARTNLPLLVRLEGPRFFVTGDHTVVSAVLNNNTADVQHVRPSLDVEGLTLSGRVNGDATTVDVPANGETRVDWAVVAEHAGPAMLRVTGRGGAHNDAMEKSFTVYEHGIDKLVARSGKLRGTEALVRLDLPSARRATTLSVQISPSLAVTMLDALPYLIDYPYGCTEQTMSRFLPAAIVARTLKTNGLDPADIEGRVFGGIESGSAAATHPKGKKDLHQLEAITTASMDRLYDFQHSDGGWGWWKEGNSDLFMTGYVVWGFAVAKEGGLAVEDEAVGRAAKYLDDQLPAIHGDHANEAWILHALAAWNRANRIMTHSKAMTKAFDDAYANRERLTAYSRALLALAAHDLGDAASAQVLVRNLEDGVQIDRTPDQSVLVRGGSSATETMATAHWGEDRFWWHWYDGPVETTSFALQALVAVDPKNALIEPVMNWLVKNRRGAQWNNTRDTAIALLGLNDYMRTSGELKGDIGYELSVNGHAIASKTVTPAGILGAPSRFVIDPAFTHDGVNEITIRRTRGNGDAPLYFSAEARFVSLEEPVKAAGNEIYVRRDYFKLVPHPTLLKGIVYETVPLPDGGSVESGDRVEVVLTVESKNDYDYLLFEDLKPAGLEAIALQSGEPLDARELRSGTVTRKFVDSPTPPGEQPTVTQRDASADLTGRTAWIYQELRDRKVAMFLDHLPQGIWEIRYTLRAEVPGAFHALPLLAQAMYVPEIRANGDEVRIEVTGKK